VALDKSRKSNVTREKKKGWKRGKEYRTTRGKKPWSGKKGNSRETGSADYLVRRMKRKKTTKRRSSTKTQRSQRPEEEIKGCWKVSLFNYHKKGMGRMQCGKT